VLGYEVKRGKLEVRMRPTSEAVMVIQGNDDGKNEDREKVDWRKELVEYISHPENGQGRRVQWQALSYTVINGELYHRAVDGLLLRCLNEEEARVAMG
jgi:hypothetical protein